MTRGQPRSFVARLAVVLAATSVIVTVRLVADVGGNDVAALDLDPVRGSRVTYLVVGSDSRAGIPAEIASMGSLEGERADTIMLVQLDREADTVRALSLPRDLAATLPGYPTQRLGGYLDYGREAFVKAVRQFTGVPINHYLESDVAGLATAVDRIGGVTLERSHAARDRVSGLDIAAGTQVLDGATAVAFARSRSYEELHEGRWRPVGADDAGRIRRQQELLAALLVESRRHGPLRLAWTAAGVRSHVVVDDGLSLGRLLLDGRAMLAADWRLDVLPARRRIPEAHVVSPFPPLRMGAGPTLLPIEPRASGVLAALGSKAGSGQ